jgi:hypothetical protein
MFESNQISRTFCTIWTLILPFTRAFFEEVEGSALVAPPE